MKVVSSLILHLVWQATPNSHLQTKTLFRWNCLLQGLLSVMLVWNLLLVICHVSKVEDSSRAVPRSVIPDPSPLLRMLRVEIAQQCPPPLEHIFLEKARVFWSPLLVTPTLLS